MSNEANSKMNKQSLPVEPEIKQGDLSGNRIAVVIPSYRVTQHIMGVISQIPAFVWRIYIVDDACPDNSGKFVETQIKDPRIRVLYHSKNQGVGAAMLTGHVAAIADRAEIIVKMDGDGQMDPAYILPLIAPILAGEADYTKGNRFLHSHQLKTMPVVRQIGNIGLSFLTKFASGYWNMFDPANGYTAIHVSVAALIDTATIDQRYFFESSMLLELGLLGAVVQDVYIPARYGAETSRLSEWHALLDFPWRLLTGFLRRIWIQYFLRDFNLVSLYLLSGLTLLGFGSLFGAYHWWRANHLLIDTPIGTVMLAVLPIILGVQLILQALALDVQNVPSHIIHRSALGEH
jgi:glycosyltransferase involved in cell wall biosynthesis